MTEDKLATLTAALEALNAGPVHRDGFAPYLRVGRAVVESGWHYAHGLRYRASHGHVRCTWTDDPARALAAARSLDEAGP